MRFLASVVLGLFLLGSSVTSVSAERNQGSFGYLMDSCKELLTKKTTDWYDAGFCAGFVRGANEMKVTFEHLLGGPSFYCIPPNVTHRQTTRVIIKYAENHPEKHHLPGVQGFAYALVGAFPCPK